MASCAVLVALIACLLECVSQCGAAILHKKQALTSLPHPSQSNCSQPQFQMFPFCNGSLSTQTRAKDLCSRMTLPEKVNLLSLGNVGVPRLGIAPLPFGEGLHGVVSHCYNASVCPTSFPHALALAASFNRSLWRATGSAIGDEARALNNLGVANDVNPAPYAPLLLWAPNVNPARDPRWGRGQETPGEDPFVCGEFIREYALGMQETSGGFVKAVSMVKHVAAYDTEGNHAVDRTDFNAVVSAQDLSSYYLVPFKAAVSAGGVRGMMCSYNAINGVPSCMNSALLNVLARSTWGFDGAVVSDCDAIADGASQQYIARSFNGSVLQQAAQALVGGCDYNCGTFWQKHLLDAVSHGVTTEDSVDTAVQRLLTLEIQLGLLDNVSSVPFAAFSFEHLGQHQLALEGALQSMVLLQNRNQLLPLSPTQRLAVIGPQMNATLDLLSNYHGDNEYVYQHSPLEALSRKGNVVASAPGCALWGDDDSGFAKVRAAALSADVAIVCVGLHPQWFDSPPDGDAMEGEGLDRINITLAPIQLRLVQAVVATGVPVVVVLINGGQLAIPWIKDNVPAIVEAWYPGEAGGDALAALLLGEQSFSGRLPYTMYSDDFVSRRPNIQDMDLRNDGGITYLYYTGIPLWPYGFGLTYTTFTAVWAGPSAHQVSAAVAESTPCVFAFSIANSGRVSSAVSVLAFIETVDPRDDEPLRELAGFWRTSALAPGSTTVGQVTIAPAVLAQADVAGVMAVVPRRYRVRIGDPDYELVGYIDVTP